MHIATASLLLLMFAPVALASGQRATPSQPVLSDVGPPGLLIDEPGDGNVWVLAPGYKARFGADGVDFIPFYGAHAPRNFPVSFRLRAVERGGRQVPLTGDVLPVRDGERIVYARGAVREVWDLRVREVEQTFVIAPGTDRGDLVVHVEVTSEAECEDVADGLRFAQPGFGAVHYGDLVAFGANDTSVAAPSRWTGSGIELRVPASFADTVAGPITVDPIVRVIDVATGGTTDLHPDVAYESGADRWLVAFERRFSVFDTDIIARRFSGDGSFIEEVAVAIGSRESYRPSVAANAGTRQFLVAWDEDTGVTDRVIKGRLRAAATTVQGTTFTIVDSAGTLVEDRSPSVGGSTATDAEGGTYLVASELWNGNTPGRIQLSRVTASGAVFTSAAGAVGEQATDPAVTKARPTNARWLLAYRNAGAVLAEAHTGVNALGAPQVVDDRGADLGPPAVAGDGTEFYVAYHRLVTPGDHNVHVAELRFVRTILTLVRNGDMTSIEGNAVVRADQKDPAIAFDGCRITYTYLEAQGASGNYDPFATVVQFEPVFSVSDSHSHLPFGTSQSEANVAIASEAEMGGDRGRAFIVFDIDEVDVRGCLFNCTVDIAGISTVRTSCGSIFAPVLTAQNPPAIGATLRVRATPIQPQSQVYLVGGVPALIPLCPAGCQLGMLSILLTVPGTDLDLPIPCGMNLIGAQIFIQNMLLGGPGGCTTAQFPVAFTLSDTMVVRVQ